MKKARQILFWILTIINFVIPKNRKLIVIYGRRMLNENNEALLDFLLNNNYERVYEIILLVSRDVQHNYRSRPNFSIVNNSILTFWYTLRAKYIFHTHGMSLCKHVPSRSQIIFNLWHGSPLKRIGLMAGEKIRNRDTYFLCASPFFAAKHKLCFAIDDRQIFIGSNPRNDVLFHHIDVKPIIGVDDNSKLIIMMPTYRFSKKMSKVDSDIEFPILNKDNIRELSDFLYRHNVFLVIKMHPYQDKISFLEKEYGNIIVLRNEDIQKKGIKLYELLGNSDALITDFSSVYFDYLLLNRPIGFAVDDMEMYSQNRGYTVDNPIELMPGIFLKDITDLKVFVEQVTNNVDNYKEERKAVNIKCNTYVTPDASQRILEFLGINK